jgi:hypothetical protein
MTVYVTAAFLSFLSFRSEPLESIITIFGQLFDLQYRMQ